MVAQGINGDSWDNWNQDRDQAIAQEASQQTPVRDDSANPQNENWNDLDADGNKIPGVTGELDAHIRSIYDTAVYKGLPVTMQVVGRRLEEEKVLGVATVLEKLLIDANTH